MTFRQFIAEIKEEHLDLEIAGYDSRSGEHFYDMSFCPDFEDEDGVERPTMVI